MDSFLIEYLKSGKAWLLMGSGSSIEMGFPDWKLLAQQTIELIKTESPNTSLTKILLAFEKQNYPDVFEQAFNSIVPQQVLAHLQKSFRPQKRTGRIYELLAKWPVNVYLTTNFDDEIQNHLTMLGETYLTYSNSEDHMSFLSPSLSNAIYKLHGDLRSPHGLIFTSASYKSIDKAPDWQYWRTTMTAIFRMQPVIIIGHSLHDPHLNHLLQAAKDGAGVNQPICWIAPDVSFQEAQEYLSKYRIRVIPYDNRDGKHLNLVRIIENISQFVFPRTSIQIQREIEEVSKSPLGANAAAPGYFVFNKIAAQNNFEAYRVNIICAAIQSIVPELIRLNEFSLKDALYLSGWPKDMSIAISFENAIVEKALEQKLLMRKGEKFSIGIEAENSSKLEQKQYEHLKNQFLESTKLRIMRNYPQAASSQALEIASYIESSLIGFFKECGLSLSTTLLDRSQNRSFQSPIPSSIIKFINQAAAKYDDIFGRQVFSTTAVDIFTQGENSEKEYLGRISQGFYAYHALGLFGEAAQERLQHSRQTVWLVDSNLQIPILALAAPTNATFRDTFSRLREIGVRFFTTEKLFNETLKHFQFAEDVIRKEGLSSNNLLAAAIGQSPYKKANQFLEGFVRWRAGGNPNDWQAYIYNIFDSTSPKSVDIKNALGKFGIEVYSLDIWPGYSPDDLQKHVNYQQSIVDAWENIIHPDQSLMDETDILSDFYKKASPEADAMVIVTQERLGIYHMLSELNEKSPAWFISQTSMLNSIDDTKITWQPDAFLRFATTLAPASNSQDANRAFDILLLGFTQLGISLLDNKTLNLAFGGLIDQAALDARKLQEEYSSLLSEKYSESLESVITRLKPSHRPGGVIQLQNEILEIQSKRLVETTASLTEVASRAHKAEKKAEELEHIKHKIDEKRREREKKSRKIKTKKKK
ncbi:MAG: SIR2 family protein [Anaerolineales bacterium]|nr:SIR2 family protein [Anaerolineales bacterium]